MNNCYYHIPELKTENIRKYFLEEFIPSKGLSFTNDRTSLYGFSYAENKSNAVEELNFSLMKDFKLPSISYFIVFFHTPNATQAIHTDGDDIIAYSSLNLVLTNPQKSFMKFYNGEYEREVKDMGSGYKSSYINWKTDPYVIEEFEATDKFTLVNPEVPHQVITTEHDRITVCFRLFGNPKFKLLTEKLEISRQLRL